MKEIAQAILLYSNENKRRYPDRLENLLLTQDIEAYVFVCPLSNDLPANGPTTQAIAANLNSPGSKHLSYIYLGKGMTQDTDPSCVVLYEPPTNHLPNVKSVNFLFADGHVESFPDDKADKLIRQLEAGINPPKQ